ncbi:MAG: acyltransferase [Candidatus Aminicenantes bacterium]|nr:MAG: acyltransferase [Candidatus Aminicenantes bacterium]
MRIRYYRFMGITIGKNCFISSDARLDVRRGKITIGDNVNIASGTYVLSHTGYRPMAEEVETVIEDNVRIFVNSVILPGVRIGRDSIVGAGSVVMRDVPPFSTVMGNPARVVQQQEPEDNKKSST